MSRLPNWWPRLRAWLERPAPLDPVDRRNAVFMQLLLLFVGCGIPANKLYTVIFARDYATTLAKLTPAWPWLGAAVDLGTDLLMAGAAWWGLALIRRGRFRLAVAQFLAAVLGSALVAYATFGYWASFGDFLPVMALALGGLVLGRRTLWTLYLVVIGLFLVGMSSDLLREARHLHVAGITLLDRAYVDLPSRVFSYLLIVVILDRCTAAMRESLAESYAQRSLLQQEMAERERTREQLLHAQKMDAVGRLASGVAHDFNNVLGIILSFVEERHRLDEPGAERGEDALALAHALRGVEMAARRGASVSRKLLDFSRQAVTRPEVFDAAGALRELQPLLRQLLPSSVKLAIEAPAAPLPIRFDRSQFELALLNIAANARDAMPGGGRFAVELEREGTEVRLTLSDDGSGMAEEVRERIFEPFFTTKPPGAGTGLGLAVVYRLVVEAGGRIEVRSAPGAGSAFEIRLPLAQAVSAVAAPATGETVHVLLIDDDDELRPLLAASLRNGGCRVSEAATGAEAERIAGEAAQSLQVLVCDDRMPDTTGEVLLPRLRRHLPRVPAILISAYLDGHGRQPPEDPFSERLPKPFAPELLTERVRRLALALSDAGRHQPETST